ncbi:hypothetical protein OQA88_3904 [Cercophora sp. LCS_1]
MADLGNYGGSDEENAEIKTLKQELLEKPDDFEIWEKLIRLCESLEGGLNRNSSPQALATLRDTYDAFLLKFPLLFGYWKKYADLEFNIAGPESAEMVYERGCASITNSVDLWTSYCAFKMDTTHTPQLVRELFERAAEHVGLDFLAHPFWDKYIEYEERQEAPENIFAILKRVIHIPMHQYARYYERLRQLAHSRPLTEIASPEELARFWQEVQDEARQHNVQKSDLELERDVRTKIDTHFYQYFQATQVETTKRWTYESEIKRPYFHVTELEESQLANWRKYLDFESEQDSNYARIVALYERCLVTCAFYDEFWLRYARWMSEQDDKEAEVRNIYLRASTMFVPISRPAIRLQFALFEEKCERVGVAEEIYKGILGTLPDSIETVVAWASMRRRQEGLDAAIDVLRTQIDSPDVDTYTKAAVAAEWATMLWEIKGAADEARAIFTTNKQWCADSRYFWQKWFDFELAQPTDPSVEAETHARIKNVYTEMRDRTRLPRNVKRALGINFLRFLYKRSGKDAAAEFLALDRELNGPNPTAVTRKAGAEGTVAHGELDQDACLRAARTYVDFFQLHEEPNSNATGVASFH